MSKFRLSRRSMDSFVGVDPTFAAAVLYGMHMAFHSYGIDSGAVEGLRGDSRQTQLRREGKSQVARSKHQMQSGGFGHAIDLLAGGDLNDDGIVDHHDRALRWQPEPYIKLAWCIDKGCDYFGIDHRWGGDWNGNGVIVTRDPAESFLDVFHFELA